MEEDVDNKEDKNLKTIISIDPFTDDEHKIIDFMANISKNIFNCTVFSREIFDFFSHQIYNETLIYCNQFKDWNKEFIIKNNDSKKNKDIKKKKSDEKYEQIRQLILQFILKSYKPHREFYCKHLNDLKKYRNNIKHYVIEQNKLKPIINSNYEDYFLMTNQFIQQKITNNYELLKLFIDDEIKNTIDWLYALNYTNTKNEILSHKPVTIKNNQFIDDVKNEKYLIKFKNEFTFRNQVKELLGINIHSKQFIIKKITQDYLCGNENYLPSDIISNIIDKVYQSYTSYIVKKLKGIKSNTPKYLHKNDKFNLLYTASSRKRIGDEFIRLNVGKFVAYNYINITQNHSLIAVNYNYNGAIYVEKKYLVKIKKKNNKYYAVKDSNNNVSYINKKSEHLFHANYMNLKIPSKIKEMEDKKLSLIDITPMYEGYKYKVCYVFKTDSIKIDNYDKKNIHNYIFIDTGVVNLLTIYNPSGDKQIILSGSQINAINHYYNKLIDKAKSLLPKGKDKIYKSKHIRDLYIKRENKIDTYFDKICSWLLKEYPDKKCIVIGYNLNWKYKPKMGRFNNRKFNDIPFKKLLDKIKWKLNKKGIDVKLTEESYTSKCDALGMEDICYHQNYKGNRNKRGLFSSSMGKLINADINGAINIGRKYMKKIGFEIKKILGKGIYNPIKIKNVSAKLASGSIVL